MPAGEQYYFVLRLFGVLDRTDAKSLAGPVLNEKLRKRNQPVITCQLVFPDIKFPKFTFLS